jgi:hypothetical protein
VAVLFSYAVLFVLVLVAALIFLESSFLQSNLGHPVGLTDYVRLAWMTSSLATVAGALGSGLEDEETVREATYGYRQQRRNAPDDFPAWVFYPRLVAVNKQYHYGST